MLTRILARIGAVAAIVAVAATASAQGTIAGTVKDSSDAVLPGVTVEASSPALIEKSRTVVTDATGQYKIVDLRPGTYTVTFSLIGFTNTRRENVELTGNFTATINAEMKVGAVEESVTVSGDSPIVDIQSTTKQRVLQHDVIESLPTGRLMANLAVLVPGVVATSNGGQMTGTFQDVGGAAGDQMTNLVAHGSRADNAQVSVNGLNYAAISGYMGGRSPNPGATQEVTVDTGGNSAEAAEGGPRINMIPREGGNAFKGSVFGSFTNHSLQGGNLDDDLKARGLPLPNSVYRIWDVNPGFGGPLMRDKLWFYATVRSFASQNYVGAGVFENLNANNPNAWTYAPDQSRPAIAKYQWSDGQGRMTWQANDKNKLAFHAGAQNRWGQRWINGDISSPEAQGRSEFPQQRSLSAEWTAPLTSRLLLEAGAIHSLEGRHSNPLPDATHPDLMINVVEQSVGRSYRSVPIYSNNIAAVLYPRVSLAYVTGAHAVKVGYNDQFGWSHNYTYQVQPPLSYRFNNGVPNQLTEYATPYSGASAIDHNVGLYAQDKWTVKRMTLNLGVRYDWGANSFPSVHLGPATLAPARDITFPDTPFQNYKDLTPRVGVAYDLFGDGKTAVRASLNKYLKGGLGMTTGNPAGSIVTSTTRTWLDSNGNFVPDCDLTSADKNGECDRLSNPNFGKVAPSVTYDPKYVSGWGNRNYNWEFSTGVQQQLAPRVSLDVAYFRRWYGNFPVTDNLAQSASDYDTFSITAPANPLLPGGGSYVVNGLFDLNPSKFGLPPNNFLTLDSSYSGDVIEHYNGVDLSLNVRLQNGILFQGGLSTGKREMNMCNLVGQVPEMFLAPATLTYAAITGSWLPGQYCDQKTGMETQVKLLGIYTVPRIDVQVSTTFQSLPGALLFAHYNAPNAVVAPSLGRPLSGGAQNITVDLVAPGTEYGDRLNQLDLRFSKILRFGRTRTALNVDVYNALNQNPVIVESQAYATYRQPQQILLARFAKFGVSFDF